MSVIAVKITKEKIQIASDSQTTQNYQKIIKTEKSTTKLMQFDDCVVGTCGYTKTNQLLALFFETNKIKDNSEREIIRFFKSFEDWLLKETNDKDGLTQNQFLLIKDKRVFQFYDYFLEEITDCYAIGSGTYWALTALQLGADVKKAVEIACQNDLYCHAPVKLIEIDK
jgi:ATP-dependent protease HslVU (ClpYQ) peptidase subunit